MRWTGAAVIVIAVALLGMAAQDEKKVSLKERQEKFMTAIQKGDVEEAYEDILKGSLLMKDKPADVENLIDKTETGVELYGGALGHDTMRPVEKGDLLRVGTAVLGCKNAPLYFYFVWYRPTMKSDWRINNVWFNDRAREFLTGQTWMK